MAALAKLRYPRVVVKDSIVDMGGGGEVIKELKRLLDSWDSTERGILRVCQKILHRGEVYDPSRKSEAASREKASQPPPAPPATLAPKREQLSLGLNTGPGIPTAPSKKTIGIGTSTKSIREYIGELRKGGVTVVVDVRASPYSQFPHFDRDRLKEALEEAGIEYVWLGDALGNPPDAKGRRTMPGFREHMKTSKYKKGLVRLKEVIRDASGAVAITCAERDECQCHRKFILQDLASGD